MSQGGVSQVLWKGRFESPCREADIRKGVSVCPDISQSTPAILRHPHWCCHRRPASIPCLRASPASTLSSPCPEMRISRRQQMRVPRRLGELARARDQLEAEHWGLCEADGCVGFGSQKLCKTRLAGLGGPVPRVGRIAGSVLPAWPVLPVYSLYGSFWKP